MERSLRKETVKLGKNLMVQFGMFLFSLNWPQRDRANGKFLPTSLRSGGGVGVCVKRGPVPGFVFDSQHLRV